MNQKKSPPAEKGCKQQIPPAVKIKILFYTEDSFSKFSSEEDSNELSVTTLTFEKVVDSIFFFISTDFFTLSMEILYATLNSPILYSEHLYILK